MKSLADTLGLEKDKIELKTKNEIIDKTNTIELREEEYGDLILMPKTHRLWNWASQKYNTSKGERTNSEKVTIKFTKRKK